MSFSKKMPQMTTRTTEIGAADGNLFESLETRASRDSRAKRTTRRRASDFVADVLAISSR